VFLSFLFFKFPVAKCDTSEVDTHGQSPGTLPFGLLENLKYFFQQPDDNENDCQD
jgi:hypothetical protein